MATDDASTAADPFKTFWSDFMNRMGGAAAWTGMPGAPANPPNPSNEAVAQMRRVFFDALSAHAEQFMRSEAFLTSMKQAMDNAMAWQKMVKDYTQTGLAQMQVPSRGDTDHAVMLIHGIEERLLKKLEQLERRIDGANGRPDARNAPHRKSTSKRNAEVTSRAVQAGAGRTIRSTTNRKSGRTGGAAKKGR